MRLNDMNKSCFFDCGNNTYFLLYQTFGPLKAIMVSGNWMGRVEIFTGNEDVKILENPFGD